MDSGVFLETQQHDRTLMKTRHLKSLKLFEENTTTEQRSTYLPNEIIFLATPHIDINRSRTYSKRVCGLIFTRSLYAQDC
jgi:hypothetical protein